MYKFSPENPHAIDDALALRILSIAAHRVGIREISFTKSSRFDFVEVGSMDLPELDLTVMSLGFNSDRCRIEGGYLYGDDQVIWSTINFWQYVVVLYCRTSYPYKVMVVRAPRPLPRYLNLVYPFNSSVWICIIGSILSLVLASHTLSLLGSKNVRN